MAKQAEHKGRADGVDKLVSQRLKVRRVMLGMSQQDLGKAVDVSIQQVQKYEKAKNRISSGKLFAFAKFLRVPITYFYDSSEESNHTIGGSFAEEHAQYTAKDEKSATEKEVINLIKAFNAIQNPQSRKKIIELIKTMA